MKCIIQISLGSSLDDYEFKTRFRDQTFKIKRFGTDGDVDQASDLILRLNKEADAIALSSFGWTHATGHQALPPKALTKLLKLGAKLQTPVTSGDTLRKVGQEWSLRHIHFKFGNNYFTNARIFFFSGVASYTIARLLAEYTQNLRFADPLLESGVPKFINNMKDLDFYAARLRRAVNWIPGKDMVMSSDPVRSMNDYLMRKAIQDSHILVVPHAEFFRFLDPYSIEDLDRKTVITSAAFDDRIDYLKDKGVRVIIDTTPQLLDNIVGVSVLEALLTAAFDIHQGEERDEELLEIISNMAMEPRVIYPSGKPYRVNRFAYVVNPPSQEFLKKLKPIEVLSDLAPGMMNTVEKAVAYAPPFVYSKVSGIQSETGVEAEGWLIALGETTEQMQAHGPEFTTKRILEASRMAKKLGAQIMGVGALPKAMKDTSLEVAKHAELPITTGNSYFASAMLWAAAEAVRRMGLRKLKKGKILRAKAMVIGATGAVGVICSHLLATAFEEVHLVGRNIAKLLALQEAIQKETPQGQASCDHAGGHTPGRHGHDCGHQLRCASRS